MVLPFVLAKLSILPRVLQPTYDAVFSTLPFWQRWRLLLLLQPINLFVSVLLSPLWLLNNRYKVYYIPTRSGPKRCLIYQPLTTHTQLKLKPLHIDIHGGGFIGGLAEQDVRWCSYLSDHTGAVVISLTHRIAPRHTFPAAHDDIDDAVAWVLDHAASMFGADPDLLTLGGSSAGGNLALSAAITLQTQKPDAVTAKAFLGFYVPVDLRLKPKEKPKPPNFPTKDPTAFLLPLLDSYSCHLRAENIANPRLHLILADKTDLPTDMLFVVAGIDILLHEQLSLVERVGRELETEGDRKLERNGVERIGALVIDKGFHGWLELPSFILEKERMQAFVAGVEFIRRVHRQHGLRSKAEVMFK